jgi:hypothetical protein
MRCSFLAVVNIQLGANFPLNIYKKGIYSIAQRGLLAIKGQNTTRNQHYGILKGHTLLPADDIAMNVNIPSLVRCPNRSTYFPNANWVKQSFSGLVHPFVNSISGTILCQLRALAHFTTTKQCFKNSSYQFNTFFRLMISTLLFYQGGHSLLEFTAPLRVDAIQEAFKPISGFSNIDLISLFFKNNQKAFNHSLDETLKYNRDLLQRKKLHLQITNLVPEKPNNKVLIEFEMKKQLEALARNYELTISRQYFSSFRAGAKKNALIQKELPKIIKCITEGRLSKAKSLLSELKLDLTKVFGRRNFFGNKPESIKLIEKAIKEIDHCKQAQANLNSPNINRISPSVMTRIPKP